MDRQTGGEADWPGRDALHDLALCLRFYSRLPVPQLPGEPDPHRAPDFTRLPRMLDRKSTRLNSSHSGESRMPSSA